MTRYRAPSLPFEFDYGLGETFPIDYVFAGAQVYYNANVMCSSIPWQSIKDTVAGHFRINSSQANLSAQNIMFGLTIPGDMGSIDHVRQSMDGIISSAGCPIRGSMVRFISNPRRDSQTQPTVNTPGVDPRHTVIPKEAANVDTYAERTDKGWLGNAVDFWTKGLPDEIAKNLGLPDGKTLLLIGGGALVLIFVVSRR